MIARISEEEFNRSPASAPVDMSLRFTELQERISSSLPQFNDPLELQKYLAAQTKAFLDARMEKEIAEFGRPSDNTRAWVKEYREMLDSIQKNSNDTKRTNDQINMSHALLAAMIRKSAKESTHIIDATITEKLDAETTTREDNKGS